MPEYDDCARLAAGAGVPVRLVWDAATVVVRSGEGPALSRTTAGPSSQPPRAWARVRWRAVMSAFPVGQQRASVSGPTASSVGSTAHSRFSQ